MPTMFCISLNFAQINANMRPTEYTNKKIAALHRGRYIHADENVFSYTHKAKTIAKNIIWAKIQDIALIRKTEGLLNPVFFIR